VRSRERHKRRRRTAGSAAGVVACQERAVCELGVCASAEVPDTIECIESNCAELSRHRMSRGMHETDST
jgi:hypothetical protein